MTALPTALDDLRTAVDTPPAAAWRALVARRLADVTEALEEELPGEEDAWLAIRDRKLARDRDRLTARSRAVAASLQAGTDGDGVTAALKRLLLDLTHHQQRVDDLVYDSVSQELGGSD